MIGGTVVDVLVVVAVLAFAWGATQLGGLASLGRLFESICAVTVAALLRDPVGSLVQDLIGTSDDFSRLVGMLLVGLGTWIAANRVYRWWRARREAMRMASDDDEFDDLELLVDDDPLDSETIARITGLIMGLGWVLLFVAMLVLQPADSVISRSAVSSRVGGMQIHRRHMLEWMTEGFPHYTQTLPKGKLGAVVGERDDLPMREPVDAKSVSDDTDDLLRSINKLRRNSNERVLAFNPDIAAVARRHAVSLANAETLSYSSPSGGALDQRVLTALGESSGAFSEDVGEEVLWAHNSVTAMNGLLDSSRARSLLTEGRWSEIGIGVASAGWFNGRVYVLLLVGPAVDSSSTDSSSSDSSSSDATSSDSASGTTDGSSIDGSSIDGSSSDGSGPVDDGSALADPSLDDPCVPIDIDGDGIPDDDSIDPSLCGTSADATSTDN